MTPLYKIILPESKGEVYAKLERFNPTGTHKDRSLEPWILFYKEKGEKEFVISSSGNSALSAAKYCAETGMKLHVFVREKISKEKLAKIQAYKNTEVKLSKTPRRDAILFSKKNNIVNLRSSVDDLALDGYKSIAYELAEQMPSASNIFIPTSSGTTLEGIYLGYKEKGVKSPALYAVQTSKVHPIANYFDKDFEKESASLAEAIVDNIAHRRDRVIEAIKETGGGGYVVSNDELQEARKILNVVGWEGEPPFSLAEIGWQSALSFAGFLKWKKAVLSDAEVKISVCLFTD